MVSLIHLLHIIHHHQEIIHLRFYLYLELVKNVKIYNDLRYKKILNEIILDENFLIYDKVSKY